MRSPSLSELRFRFWSPGAVARLASELQAAVSQFKVGDEGNEMKSVAPVKEKTPRKGLGMKPRATYRPADTTLHAL